MFDIFYSFTIFELSVEVIVGFILRGIIEELDIIVMFMWMGTLFLFANFKYKSNEI